MPGAGRFGVRSECLGQFWKAGPGQFSRAPKLVVERADGTSAAKQCECHGKPTRTVPNAKPITEEVAVAVTAALCEILEFAPTTVMGQMVISDALMSMCNTEEEAFWLLRRVSELYKKWGS